MGDIQHFTSTNLAIWHSACRSPASGQCPVDLETGRQSLMQKKERDLTGLRCSMNGESWAVVHRGAQAANSLCTLPERNLGKPGQSWARRVAHFRYFQTNDGQQRGMSSRAGEQSLRCMRCVSWVLGMLGSELSGESQEWQCRGGTPSVTHSVAKKAV